METFAALVASTLVLALVFGPLERLFPARKEQPVFRPGWGVDACFYLGQYLLFAGLTTWVLSAIARLADAHAVFPLRAAFRSLPFPAQAVISIAFGDLLIYWFHRACHRYDFLWRFHAVHHSAEHLDWLAAHREHPLDGLASQICLNLPGIVLGLPFEAMGAFAVVRGMWAVFIHSNVHLPVGPLRYILGAPEVHHWHHLRAERTRHNFANLGPWVDLLFGTYHRPEGPETFPLGISDPWPKGYLAQLAEPFLPRRRASAQPAAQAPAQPAAASERPAILSEQRPAILSE